MPDTLQNFDITLMASPEVVTDVTLARGPCTLTVIAPFGIAVTVLPVPGLTFRDLDANANVFNAEFTVPKAGSYRFTVMLSAPVDGDKLHISFSGATGSGGGSTGPAPKPDMPAYPPAPMAGW